MAGRQRDRLTAEGQTDREADRQTERHICGQTDCSRSRQTARGADRQTDRETGGQTDRPTDCRGTDSLQRGRHKERQADRQTDRQEEIYTCMHNVLRLQKQVSFNCGLEYVTLSDLQVHSLKEYTLGKGMQIIKAKNGNQEL